MALPRSPRVVVTGAQGFVGSEVVRRCRRAGLDVVPTCRALADPRDEGLRVLDVTRPATIAPALEGADVVIHAAGLAHQFGRPPDDATFMAVNAEGTANVARAAAACRVGHLVLLSSVAVYGPHGSESVDEDFPCRPGGAYGWSKLDGERHATRIAEEHGLALTILRPATIYGEGDPGNIGRLMRAIDARRFVWIGDGSNRKSLVHRDDVARACLAVLTRATPCRAVFNVSAAPCTVREIVDELSSALTKPVPRWHVPAGALQRLCGVAKHLMPGSAAVARTFGTVEKWLADDVYDGSRFNRAFSFEFSVSLADGLRRAVEWHRGAPGTV